MAPTFVRASTLSLSLGLAYAVLLFSQSFLTCFPPPKLAALSAFIPLAAALAAAGGVLRDRPPFAAPLAAVIACFAVGLARSGSADSFALSFTLPACAAAAAWLANTLGRIPAERSRILLAFVLAHLLAGLYGVAQYYGLDPFTWTLDYGPGRVFSTLGNPNFLAGHLALTLPVLVALGTTGGGILRWMARAAFLACFPAMVFAQTRGAWAGLFAGLAVAAAAGFRGRASFPGLFRDARWALAIALAVSAAFSLPSLNPTGLSLPSQLASSANLEQQSARQRFFWWTGAAHLFAAAPVAGAGLGNFMREFPAHARAVMGKWFDLPPAFADHPHNDWLFLLAEHGVVGMGLILWLAAAWARILLRRIREGDLLALATLAGGAGLAVHAAWNMPSLQHGTMITAGVLLGLTCSTPRAGYHAAREEGPVSRTVLAAGLALALAVAFRPAVLLLAQDYFNGGRIVKESRGAGAAGVSSYLFRAALKLTDAPWRVNFMLGSTLYGRGFYTEALSAFRADEAENPFGADSILHQGKCLREMGRLEEALRECRRALRLVPNYADASFTIATIEYRRAEDLRRTRGLAEARTPINRARLWLNYTLAAYPRHVEALILLGHLAIMERKWDEAEARWSRALELMPGNDGLRRKLESLQVDLPRLKRGGAPR